MYSYLQNVVDTNVEKRRKLPLKDPLLRWLAAATLPDTFDEWLRPFDKADMRGAFLVRVDHVQPDLLEHRWEVPVKDSGDIGLPGFHSIPNTWEDQ